MRSWLKSGVTKVRLAYVVILVSGVFGAAGLGAFVYFLSIQSGEGAETHTAVCALTADLEERTDASRAFLAEHPNGAFGIPASTIRDSVQNQERTIDALSVVDCD